MKNYINVLPEYEAGALPGEGRIEFEEGYAKELHQNEMETAQWLHDTFGGDIILLNEKNNYNRYNPDYEWKGKFWELKNPTTEKAANNAIRHGLKQIKDNPGGIILDFKDHDICMEKLQSIIDKRLSASAAFDVDIMIVEKGKTVKIMRYKKTEALNPHHIAEERLYLYYTQYLTFYKSRL